MAIHSRHVAIVLSLCLVAGCASMGPDTRHSTSSGDGSNSDAAWAQLDTNQDGSLSIDELDRQHAVGLLRDMRWADANGDGQVSRAEWNAWWPVMTKTAPSENMAGLVGSSAPTDGLRSF